MSHHDDDLKVVKFDNTSKVILVIDDDDSIRLSIVAFLEDNQYAALESSTGKDGVEKFLKHSPDLVLLDLRMPDMNGMEVMSRLGEIRQNIPILVITGQGSMNDAIEALKAGAWDFLKKPLDFNRLKHAMNVCFEKDDLLKKNLAHLKKLQETNHKLNIAILEATKAQDALKKATEAKNEFMAKVSNELKIPTIGVESMADILLDTELSHEQQYLTKVIQANITSLGSSIDKLVDFSKIETNRINLENAHFDLHAMIADIIFKLKHYTNNDFVSFKKIIEPDVPVFLIGDPWHLGKLLFILLENAFKFTPKGEIYLKVSALIQNEHSVTLKFDIQDSGVGIDQNVLAGLFESFHHSDTEGHPYSGLGLGLALAKKLASIMNGQIGMGSTIGEGTAFWFTVSIVKQPDNSRRDDTGIGKNILPMGVFKSHNLNILLADSNENAQMIAGAFFLRLGCSYKIAKNSTQTLELLETEKFDLLLIDLLIDGLTGFEITGIVRSPMSAVLNHDIPIIGTGDRDDATLKKRGYQAGINAYIPRPYTFPQLANALQNTLSIKTSIE